MCYNTKQSTKIEQLETFVSLTSLYLPQAAELEIESNPGQKKQGNIKVFNGLCVENCLVSEMMAGAGSGFELREEVGLSLAVPTCHKLACISATRAPTDSNSLLHLLLVTLLAMFFIAVL